MEERTGTVSPATILPVPGLREAKMRREIEMDGLLSRVQCRRLERLRESKGKESEIESRCE